MATSRFSWSVGIDPSSASFIHDDCLCCKSGRLISFLTLDKSKMFQFQPRTRSVKHLAVHPINQVFAIGESDVLNPTVQIYDYPYLNEIITLKDCGLLEMKNLVFSSGDFILAISGIPDHRMTIWNYKEGTVIGTVILGPSDYELSISFNPINWRQIVCLQGSVVHLWNIEECGTTYLFHHKMLKCPAEDSLVDTVTDPQADSRITTRSSTRMTRQNLELPNSAIAGVSLEDFRIFEDAQDTTVRIIGVDHCWSHIGDIFIAGKNGEILKFDTERINLRVLLNPNSVTRFSTGSVSFTPDLQFSDERSINMACCIAFSKHGIYAGGQDGLLRLMQLDGKNANEIVNIQNLHQMKDNAPLVCMAFNDQYDYLALSSALGEVDILTTSADLETEPRVLEMLPSSVAGKFVAIGLLSSNLHYSVTIQDFGLLQIWNTENGELLGCLDMKHKISVLSAYPLANYVAVGTSSGHLLLVDCIKMSAPRIIYGDRLHEKSIEFVKFDRLGRVMLTVSNDGYIIIMAAPPSKQFEIMGCVEFPGTLLDCSVHVNEVTQDVHIVVLSDADGSKYGNRITYFQLTNDVIQNYPEHHNSAKCDFKPESINKMILTHINGGFGCELFSTPEGVILYTVDRNQRNVQQILLPSEAPKKSGNKASLMDYVEGKEAEWRHECINVHCCLSPHGKILATYGTDGVLHLMNVEDNEQLLLLKVNDHGHGGTKQVLFAPNSFQVFAVGMDGEVLKIDLKLHIQKQYAEEHYKSFMEYVGISYASERSALESIPTVDSTKTRKLSTISQKIVEDEKKDRKLSFISMDTSTQADDDLTWIQKKQTEAHQEEKKKYTAQKEEMKTKLQHIRANVVEMVNTNATLPDIEKLDRQEFELDIEEQNLALQETEKAVQAVREEIELEMLAKQFTREVLKKESWDDMKVKGRAICAFNSTVQVNNFPLKARTAQELEELDRVVKRRKIELADRKENLLHLELLQKTAAQTDKEDVDDDLIMETEGNAAEVLHKTSHTELLYDQLDLTTREQKINQITLLQDNIYRLKEVFNKDFDDTFLKKEQEIAKIKDKNSRIKKILIDLNLTELLTPDLELNSLEKPEKLLVVDDKEITVEKYLSPEQKKKLEEERLAEEERRRREKADNWRERGLDEMMGGVLEIKKEDELKKEIPKPPCMLLKSEEEWNDDEKKLVADYERRVKEQSEEREKFKKQLEAEYKKLSGFIEDGKQSFDEVLLTLFGKYIRTFFLVLQDELKIWRLKFNLMQQEELISRQKELQQLLEEKSNEVLEIQEILQMAKKTYEECKEKYSTLAAEEKLFLEKGFKKEFNDIPAALVERLMKLLRRQKRNPTGQVSVKVDTGSQNPYSERPSSSRRRLYQIKHDEDELHKEDEKRPDDIDDALWTRFCNVRRRKRQHDNLLKKSADEVADLESFIKKRQTQQRQCSEAGDNIRNLMEEIENERLHYQVNVEIQLVIKQGLVEVEVADNFIHDFLDSLLLDRRRIEDLNEKICKLGEIKVKHMMEGKEFKKRFKHLEWELRRMLMEYTDLETRLKDIQRFKITREVQRYLNSGNYEALINVEITKLDRAIETLKQHHEKAMQEKKSRLDMLTKVKTKNLERKNINMRDDLTEMNVTLNERLLVMETVDQKESAEGTREKRYSEILQRQKLVDIAKSQAKEVAVLRAEVERLRMRTFPALVQNK